MYVKSKRGGLKVEILKQYTVRTRWVDYKDKEFDPYVMYTSKDESATTDCHTVLK